MFNSRERGLLAEPESGPDDEEEADVDDEKADIEDKEVAAAAEVTEADEVLEPF